MERSAINALLNATVEEQKEKGYSYTANEIASQPCVWKKTDILVRDALPRLAEFLKGTSRLLLSGAGSSHYVSLSVAPLLSSVFPVVEAIPSTEILMDPESAFPREPFVLVSFARSGDSPEGNAVAELAGRFRPGLVKQLAITCNRSGKLAQIVAAQGGRGFVLFLPEESNDKSLAMTSSFSSLCLAGASLAYLDRSREYSKQLETLISAGDSFIGRASDLGKELTADLPERGFFLASRPFLGGAFEARLKVQELTAGRIITVAEDTLGFRHGPMAAVNGRSLIFLFMSQDQRRKPYELDMLKELKDKGLGRKIIAVSPYREGLEDLAGAVLDYRLDSPLPDGMLSVLVAVVGQLVGLFASLSCGLKPDTPSPSGVISRVVQGIRIHPEVEKF